MIHQASAEVGGRLAKQCLCSLIPTIESPNEPSHGPGAHPRSSCAEAFSREVLREYFDVLRVYVKSEMDIPPLEAAGKTRTSRTREYFKQKKEAAKLTNAGVSKRNSKHKFSSFRRTRPTSSATLPAVSVLQCPPMELMWCLRTSSVMFTYWHNPNKAYPDVPAEATSLQKAEILCRQLANWNGSYCLTEALETSSCEQAYEKVKEAALRLERSLKTAEECRIATRARSTHNFNQKHAVGDKQPGPFVGKGTEEIAKIGTDKPRKLPLSNKPETTPPYQQRRRDHGPPRCYKCGKRGHMAKDCSVSSSRQQHSSVLREDPNQTSSVAYASLIDKWMCTIWEESASSVSEWFGQKPLSETTKILLMLPDSFRLVNSVFRDHPDVERRLYRNLSEIGGSLESSTARLCVLVGPTTESPIPKRDWCKLASSLATAARMGMKVVAVAPPRGDKAYAQNRADMNDAIKLAKSAAALAKQCLCSLIPTIESPNEPSHGPGAHPRSSCAEAFSREVLREYFDVLRVYVKSEMDIPPLEAAGKTRTSRTREYFKQKKEAAKLTNAGVSKRNSKHKFSSFRREPVHELDNATSSLCSTVSTMEHDGAFNFSVIFTPWQQIARIARKQAT
ncbi:zinc knuckle [Cooperia oncophora]